MIYFIFGFFLAIFLLPLVQNLEVLLQQMIEVKRAKLAKQVYDINKQMEQENEVEPLKKHYGFGFDVSPYVQQNINDPSEQEEE